MFTDNDAGYEMSNLNNFIKNMLQIYILLFL